MRKNPLFIKNFKDIDTDSLSSEPEYLKSLMRLIEHNIHAPDGFIISSNAFEFFISKAYLQDKITRLLSTTHFERPDSVMQVSKHIGRLIDTAPLPPQLENEIFQKFHQLADNRLLTINHSPKIISSYESFIEQIKEIWSTQFEAKSLFMHKGDIERRSNGTLSILVQTYHDTRLKGKLYTSHLTINTHAKLKKDQTTALEELGRKIQKIFLLPQEVDWVIIDNKLIVTRIRPQTDV